MKRSIPQALGIGIGLFLAVYVPAFVTTALVRPRLEIAIPLIIAVTFLVAFILIFVLARPPAGIAEFGFKIPKARYVANVAALGLVLGAVVTFLCHLFPSKPPFDASGFPRWMIGLYFILGASIQEEIIFRGLIQTMMERKLTDALSVAGDSVSSAVIFTALLFGIIHLEAGALVAIGAIVLGLAAGELRRRSGSLVPAIVVHMLFNAADAFWSRK